MGTASTPAEPAPRAVTAPLAPDPHPLDEHPDAVTPPEGQPVTIGVLANDSSAAVAASVQSSELSEPSEISRPYLEWMVDCELQPADCTSQIRNSLAVVGVARGSHGLVTINRDGTVTYTPDPHFNGTDSFIYLVTDWLRGADIATVVVIVNAINDAPYAMNDVATVDEDTAVKIDVLTNDTDVDGDAMSVSDVTQGSHGSVARNADDTVTYTPAADFNGVERFT